MIRMLYLSILIVLITNLGSLSALKVISKSRITYGTSHWWVTSSYYIILQSAKLLTSLRRRTS